jgi:hypothetical protein
MCMPVCDVSSIENKCKSCEAPSDWHRQVLIKTHAVTVTDTGHDILLEPPASAVECLSKNSSREPSLTTA